MFKEILKIDPRIEGRDLDRMEKSLNGRFARVAKKFGGGLASVLKGGALLGVATSFIDKLLSPYEDTLAAINKSLNVGDDLDDYAQQFNTTAGNLARLQAVGQAKGLDPEQTRLLLGKFQGKVAEATADPTKDSSVRAFVGREDMAEAFFEFVQSMDDLTAVQKNLVQQEVFGEKQILKAADFFNSAKDFGKILQDLGGPSPEVLSAAAGKLGYLKSRQDLADARRGLNDLPVKALGISSKTIDAIGLKEDLVLSKENKNIGKFGAIAEQDMINTKIINEVSSQLIKLLPIITGLLQDIASGQGAIKTSRAIRGAMKETGF